MAPSYKQNTAKIGEIHGTVNLGFKRPVHEGYMHSLSFRFPRRQLLLLSMALGLLRSLSLPHKR